MVNLIYFLGFSIILKQANTEERENKILTQHLRSKHHLKDMSSPVSESSKKASNNFRIELTDSTTKIKASKCSSFFSISLATFLMGVMQSRQALSSRKQVPLCLLGQGHLHF